MARDCGVELAKIRELLRHTDVGTTMRYVKIRDAAKHDAIALRKGAVGPQRGAAPRRLGVADGAPDP